MAKFHTHGHRSHYIFSKWKEKTIPVFIFVFFFFKLFLFFHIRVEKHTLISLSSLEKVASWSMLDGLELCYPI